MFQIITPTDLRERENEAYRRRAVWLEQQHAALCPFCQRRAHARACPPLRALLFAADPPDGPPTIDQEGDIDRP